MPDVPKCKRKMINKNYTNTAYKEMNIFEEKTLSAVKNSEKFARNLTSHYDVPLSHTDRKSSHEKNYILMNINTFFVR